MISNWTATSIVALHVRCSLIEVLIEAKILIA